MAQSERRRYFRVNDLVGLKYRFLSLADRELAIAAQPHSLNNLLATMDSEIEVILASLEHSHPDLKRLLELYNEKINLAFGHGLADHGVDNPDAVKAQAVNISACGIAFACDEMPGLNQGVALDVTLYPSNTRLQLLASVIACDPNKDETSNEAYVIRANFEHLSDAEQETLVQHVIKRQATMLKSSKEEA